MPLHYTANAQAKSSDLHAQNNLPSRRQALSATTCAPRKLHSRLCLELHSQSELHFRVAKTSPAPSASPHTQQPFRNATKLQFTFTHVIPRQAVYCPERSDGARDPLGSGTDAEPLSPQGSVAPKGHSSPSRPLDEMDSVLAFIAREKAKSAGTSPDDPSEPPPSDG